MIVDEHYLYMGTLFVHKKPHVVTTVLGSCVSVCLWDCRKQIGGINHYVLPFWNGEGLASPKYGNIAIEKLLKKMFSLGSKQKNLKAKLFGGATVLPVGSITYNVGKRNIMLAQQMLKEFDIPVIASDIGGSFGRKLKFYTESGTVMVKRFTSWIPNDSKWKKKCRTNC